MADYSAWRELAIPGASLLARCAGRGRLLVDPLTVATIDLLMRHVENRVLELILEIETDQLRLILGRFLELGVAISDELDRRQFP